MHKLTYDAIGAKVLSHTAYNPYFRQNTTLWDAVDFIASLTQFIPPWGVRYMTGWKDSHPDELPAVPAPIADPR